MCQKVNYNINRRSSIELIAPVYGASISANGDNRNKLYRKRNNLKFKKQMSNDELTLNLSESSTNLSSLQNDTTTTTAATTPLSKMEDNPIVEPYKGDALAIITQMTRDSCIGIKHWLENFKNSTAYSILTGTTQPAHVITVLVVSFLVYVIYPKLSGTPNPVQKTNIFALILYLGSFATHFGAQIWMTFVSGLALYFSLPRHIFGLCQQVLFPKYYALGSILSIVTLFCYVRCSQTDLKESSYLQIIVLTLCAGIELIIRLYLAPPLLSLMRVKHEFESKAGTGREVGQLIQGGLVRCPHYQNVHKTFRRIHMVIAIGNILSLACTFIHLEYLASKINL